MDQFTNEADVATGGSSRGGLAAGRKLMNFFINTLIKFGILKENLDYHLIRASMVIIFFLGIRNGFHTRQRY